MPIQAPQWTDYLNCPVCCREFGAPPRSPISLGCGHTLCRHCLKHLHRKQCPFDQAVIQVEPEELVVNTALLQLAGYTPPAQPYHPPSIQALPEHDKQAYDCIVKCMEHLAVYLKYCGNVNNSMASSRLSRPMQRKLVMLLQCAITDEEGRGRAARAARSLGERTVTELILQHQNPQQLSANLWAAVRARGCQFLGPAMQEEVLKLVLLALEDGSALSRKVLVMFVVQRLEPHFPQASKTSIGHVVQLLYRASCFKVSKRECDSSLMQLKEEFRTYESLRREHDAQIVQIATEAGLRIAPDQWSALLYGDTAHKSHMQSIIDKLQTPQSFAQSVQELFIALQRTGDPAQLVVMSLHLDRLANIDASPDTKSPSWQQLAEVMTSLKEVVAGLIHYLQQQATGRDSNHNQKLLVPDRLDTNPSQGSPQTAASTPTHTKYKMSMCRDAATRSFCPRGSSCTFAHSEEELERFRLNMNGNYTYVPVYTNQPVHGSQPIHNNQPIHGSQAILSNQTMHGPQPIHGAQSIHGNVGNQPIEGNQPLHGSQPIQPISTPGIPVYPQFPISHHIVDEHNFNLPQMPPANISVEMGENPHVNGHQGRGYSIATHHPIILSQPLLNNEILIPPSGERFYPRYNPRLAEELRAGSNVPYRTDFPPPYVCPTNYHIYSGVQDAPPTQIDELFDPVMDMLPEYLVAGNTYGNLRLDPRPDAVWAPNPGEMFNFGEMRCALPGNGSPLSAETFPPVRSVMLPMVRSRRASPVEGASPRAVGGPVSVPATATAPCPSCNSRLSTVTAGPTGQVASGNGPPENQTVPANRRAVGADRLPRDRSTVTERLTAATQAYQITGFDDQELEAGLQALERRIDTEFKNAD